MTTQLEYEPLSLQLETGHSKPFDSCQPNGLWISFLSGTKTLGQTVPVGTGNVVCFLRNFAYVRESTVTETWELKKSSTIIFTRQFSGSWWLFLEENAGYSLSDTAFLSLRLFWPSPQSFSFASYSCPQGMQCFNWHSAHTPNHKILSYAKKQLVSFCELVSICGKFLN